MNRYSHNTRNSNTATDSNWRHRHFRIHRKILLLYPNGLWSNISGGLPTGSPYNSANGRVFFAADCQRYSPSPTCDTRPKAFLAPTHTAAGRVFLTIFLTAGRCDKKKRLIIQTLKWWTCLSGPAFRGALLYQSKCMVTSYSGQKIITWQAYTSPASLGFPPSYHRRANCTNSSTSSDYFPILYI